MWYKTDNRFVHSIGIWILVSVDAAERICVSYYKNMLSSKDTNNMMYVTMPDQIQICGLKLLLQSFT
jgi:hypothetical protein